jgi:osmotically-inducible protein OsmY
MSNTRGAAVLFPSGYSGDIHVRVDDGVVVLTGHVSNCAEKQLAGRLAWHVPGCRDVVNAINAPLAPR